jgi:hypothetical protein
MASKPLNQPLSGNTLAVKTFTFIWEGRDRGGKPIRGEMRAGGDAVVRATLRRQGITVTKVKKQSYRSGKKVTEKDITVFTRQLATMMKAGVPLLQAFDIVGKGHSNAAVSQLLMAIKTDVETVEVLLTPSGDVGDKLLRRETSLFSGDHDGRAVGVVGTDKVDRMPLHALEAHPNIGLDVLHHVPNVEVAIGIGQGGGDK